MELLLVGALLISIVLAASILTVLIEIYLDKKQQKKNLKAISENIEIRSWREPKL